MKLTVDGKEIEVKPLTYKQAKQFRPRFEEWDKARKAAGESGWGGYYDIADLAADMIVESTGLDKDTVEGALPLHEAADFMAYMQAGPSYLEKKRPEVKTTTTT
jgi:hypothetical protein